MKKGRGKYIYIFLFFFSDMLNRKLELENSKTKQKLDQLRLVMQQKKERREARKLKSSPYNGKLTLPLPALLSPNSSQVTESSSNLGNISLATASSSNQSVSESTSTTATAIAQKITANSETLENHLAEEVDTVA